MGSFLVVHEDCVISKMSFGEHRKVIQLGMFAIAADSFFKKISSIFRLIPTGDKERYLFSFPNRRTYFFAIVFIETVHKAVQYVFIGPVQYQE